MGAWNNRGFGAWGLGFSVECLMLIVWVFIIYGLGFKFECRVFRIQDYEIQDSGHAYRVSSSEFSEGSAFRVQFGVLELENQGVGWDAEPPSDDETGRVCREALW